jgi:hypothetical protein
MSKADPQRQKRSSQPAAPPPPVPPAVGDVAIGPPRPPALPPGLTAPPLPPTPVVSAATTPPSVVVRPGPAVRSPSNPAARPQPTVRQAPQAPVPAVASPKSPAAIGAVTAPAEAESTDATEVALKSAPPFLISMLVHSALIIVLALVTLKETIEDQLQLEAVYSDTVGQQLLDNTLQSPQAMELQVESPAFSLGLTDVDNPLAAPPNLPDFFNGGNRATSTIDAPSIGLALTGREPGMKKALSSIYGASATTEGAVVAGLEWLKKQQMRDGGWSLAGPFPNGSNSGDDRCAATAMALLAFQGYGATHIAGATSPDFHDVVERGWNFLLKMQDKDGYFQHEGTATQRAYAQAQATIALCEIYGMTKDAKFKRPAQLALDWAHKAQDPELGGWRYQPRVDSDTSVTGWYVMAFQSGLMAGLEVQSPNLELVKKFLDIVAMEDGTKYCYQPGREATPTMTAEAILCRQYLGWKHDDPRMRAAIDYVLANPIDYEKDPNVYYWYYATQACHHMDGDDWNRWNAVMRQAVPTAQTKSGPERGSWLGNGDPWASHGGRLYSTCLSIFMLETYYRHLPIYKWRLK